MARIRNGEARADTIYIFSTAEESALFAAYLHLYLIDDIVIGVKEKQNYLAEYTDENFNKTVRME
jgi:hypothetical protein